jgi:hypothetical protein
MRRGTDPTERRAVTVQRNAGNPIDGNTFPHLFERRLDVRPRPLSKAVYQQLSSGQDLLHGIRPKISYLHVSFASPPPSTVHG